jgi:hypothetical protein
VGPKQAISSAFFDDLIVIIDGRKEYEIISNEISEAIFFYSYTLDYQEKPTEHIQLLLELVIILIYSFDRMYINRLDEEAIIVYKNSLIHLKQVLFNSL